MNLFAAARLVEMHEWIQLHQRTVAVNIVHAVGATRVNQRQRPPKHGESIVDFAAKARLGDALNHRSQHHVRRNRVSQKVVIRRETLSDIANEHLQIGA